MRFYFARGNLLVNVDQQNYMPTQTQKKKKHNASVTVILWCGCVTVVKVEEQ